MLGASKPKGIMMGGRELKAIMLGASEPKGIKEHGRQFRQLK
jgi:hypothetical protein